LAHYQRFVGPKIKCRLKKAVEGERRNFTGVLQAAAADEISIADGDDVMTLPLAAIARANLVAEW
jgi:ribosome maturation factor RimP